MPVLPPIPTAHLTTEDVADLTTRTRDIMVQALREISVQSSTQISAPEQTPIATTDHRPAADELPPPVITSALKPEIPVESTTEAVRKRTISTTSSRVDAGAETEEDDGMVLVNRPQ